MSRTFFTEFTKEQTKVLEWFEEHIDEPELTLNLPTGFGKSLMICETMKQFGRVMIVFPTLTLMDTFYKKYQAYFDKPTLFICTENKDIKSFQKETGHDFESLQGKQSKKALKETVEEQIILTTYSSFPFVSQNITEVDVVYFDEAHHRGDIEHKNKVQEAIETYTDKFIKIVNVSATPSECCGGEIYAYSLRDAIEDGYLRDFDLHILILGKGENLVEYLERMTQQTHNTKAMLFTGFSEAEKEDRENVLKTVKNLKTVCALKQILLEGIVGNTPRSHREQIIQRFVEYPIDKLSLLVSCKTIGEGVDIPGTNSIVFVDPITNHRLIIQRIGRALRLYRDDSGVPKSSQPNSSVILPVYVDIEEYQSFTTDEQRDEYIRQLCNKDNTCFQNILNVVSALREDGDFHDLCMFYPSGIPKEKMKEVDENLREQQFQIVPVPADGNCFFHCMSKVLNKPHEQIRRELVDHLAQSSSLQQESGISAEQIQELYQPGRWNNDAMDVMPRVASERYNLPIRVHMDENVVAEFVPNEPTDSGCDLLLSENHYSLIVKNGSEIAQTSEILSEGLENSDKSKGLTETHIECQKPDTLSDTIIPEVSEEFVDSVDSGNSVDSESVNLQKSQSNLPQTQSTVQNKVVRNPRRKVKFHLSDKVKVLWKVDKIEEYYVNLKHELILNGKTKDDLWYDTLDELAKFVDEHHRAPIDRSTDDTEKRLGQWLNRQKRNYKNQKRSMKDPDRRQKWEAFMEKYPELFKTKESWIEILTKIDGFIKSSGSLPSIFSADPVEKKMGCWLKKQMEEYRKQHWESSSMHCPIKKKDWEEFINKYSPNLFLTPQQIFWRNKFSKVKEFIRIYNSFPSKHSQNEEEKILGKWLDRQSCHHTFVRIDENIGYTEFNMWKEFVNQYHYNLCKAFLKKTKTQCKKSVKQGFDFCNLHLKNIDSKELQVKTIQREERQCVAYNITGERCKNNAWSCWSSSNEQSVIGFEKKKYCNTHLKKNLSTNIEPKWSFEEPSSSNSINPNECLKKIVKPGFEQSKQNSTLVSTPSKPMDLSQLSRKELEEKVLQLSKSYPSGYQATNPLDKDEINELLVQHSPRTGLHVVLDDVDFKTSKALAKVIPVKNLFIPQRNIRVYKTMRENTEFKDAQIVNDDLIHLPAQDIGLMYADLCGSIREAKPIIRKFLKCIIKDGIFAITISCREPEKSKYTNHFMSKLSMELGRHYGSNNFEIIEERLYGAKAHMGTIILKRIQ